MHRCFTVNFTKFLRIPFLTEHLQWLLLSLPLNASKAIFATGCVSQFDQMWFWEDFKCRFSHNFSHPFLSSYQILSLNTHLFTSLYYNNSSAIFSPLFSFHYRREDFSMCDMTLGLSMDCMFRLSPVFSIELPIPPWVKSRWPKQSNMVIPDLQNKAISYHVI